MTLALAITMMAGFPAVNAYAASGSVYTCTINRSYSHPVTGVIEDSGGEGSYATGQGMVESCVNTTGILEKTDDGAYYLTIRLSLMDYTSGHSFKVQNYGDSGWSTPSEIGTTATGSDSNGSTADVCIRVPSENCVIRGSMYVDPMGRDVIFYVYPSNYKDGNSTNMKATMVTEASSADTSAQSNSADNNAASSGDTSAQSSSSDNNQAASTDTANNTDAAASTEGENAANAADAAADTAQENAESSVSEVEQPSTSSTLDSAAGLSLSTKGEDDSSAVEESNAETTSEKHTSNVLVIIIVILVIAAAVVAYLLFRNRSRKGGAEDDDEE